MVSFFFNALREIFLLFNSTKRQAPFNFILLKFNFHYVVPATYILWSCIWLRILSQQRYMYMLLLEAHRGSPCLFSLRCRSQVAVFVHGTADFLSIFCLKGVILARSMPQQHPWTQALFGSWLNCGQIWAEAESSHAKLHSIQSSTALNVSDSVFTAQLYK